MISPALSWALLGTLLALGLVAALGPDLTSRARGVLLTVAVIGTALVVGQITALPATAPAELQHEQAR